MSGEDLVSASAMMLAASWGANPFDVKQNTSLTRWAERQISFIEDRFDLDLPDVTVIEIAGGEKPEGGPRLMCVGGKCRPDGTPKTIVIGIADDIWDRFTPTALHYVVRHEIAHIIDRQERGTSDETSAAFRDICDRIRAPLGGRAREVDSGIGNAHRYAEDAPQEVQDFASRGFPLRPPLREH